MYYYSSAVKQRLAKQKSFQEKQTFGQMKFLSPLIKAIPISGILPNEENKQKIKTEFH